MKEKLKFLQIDTSNEDVLFIKLFNNGKEQHILIQEKRIHLKMLVPSIQEILKNNEVSLNDLDFIALNEGPGSWTGLRIGFSTIKIIAQINNLKLIVYSNFEILENKYETNTGVFLVPTNNSKYYYYVLSKNQLIGRGVISELELSDFYPQLNKYYYSSEDLDCNKLLLKKFEAKDFSDPKNVEPFYIVEGVIFNKSDL